MIATHAVTMNGSFSGELKNPDLSIEDEIRRVLSSLDGADIFAISLWELPAGKELDQVNHKRWPVEYIQCAGTADRMTVEVRRLESKQAHQFVVAASGEEVPATELIQWDAGRHSTKLRPSEVMSWEEAAELFIAYYETGAVPPKYHLRELSLG
jgi:hypothetical protein